MEEDASKGARLYHEKQEGNLCGLHCVNTILQGPFFCEVDFGDFASAIDGQERLLIDGQEASPEFLAHDSYNVSTRGDFSIQVLQKALEVWGLQAIPQGSPVLKDDDPELETAFMCHLDYHWFCIRKVNGEWYNFNSRFAAPKHLSKSDLSEYLNYTKGDGCSIFVVKGSSFPNECFEPRNTFGKWWTPEDVKRTTLYQQLYATYLEQKFKNRLVLGAGTSEEDESSSTSSYYESDQSEDVDCEKGSEDVDCEKGSEPETPSIDREDEMIPEQDSSGGISAGIDAVQGLMDPSSTTQAGTSDIKSSPTSSSVIVCAESVESEDAQASEPVEEADDAKHRKGSDSCE